MTARRHPFQNPTVFLLLLVGVLVALLVAPLLVLEGEPAPRQEVITEPGEPLPAYDRVAQYGRAWIDTDGNGCDQRNDVLKRDLIDAVLAADGCKVLRGTLVDPYTGTLVEHVTGDGVRSKVQIDHVYALRDVHDDGAMEWTYEQRVAFANDRRFLVATSGSVNGSKGSQAPSTWSDNVHPDQVCWYWQTYLLAAASYGADIDSEQEAYLEPSLKREC